MLFLGIHSEESFASPIMSDIFRSALIAMLSMSFGMTPNLQATLHRLIIALSAYFVSAQLTARIRIWPVDVDHGAREASCGM